MDEPTVPVSTKAKPEKVKKVISLRNVSGEEMDEKDYFYSAKGKDSAPDYFNRMCGQAVTREDMLEVFNKVFKKEHNFLFYKVEDKEVYLVIVPLKFALTVGEDKDSIEGDFQKHAMSFLVEGSVNLDTLRRKLTQVKSTIKTTD